MSLITRESALCGVVAIGVTIFIASAFGGTVPTKNECPGVFYEARITDCTAFPCNIYKGKNYTVEIDFSPMRETNNSVIKCKTIYYGKDFDIPEDPVCPKITPEGCPLVPEKRYTYTAKFSVPQFVPSTYYPIRCGLVDENKAEHICLNGSGRVI